MHTASQALAIERQASAQPSLAERVSRPKTRAILGLMRLNFLSVILRPMGGYGLGECLRITVGTAQANARLLAALDEVMA
jgi:histidinol-phosphate/aromatic aminotransferase/cobyric acid decarboxylase-like protein